ncbi:synaphin protein domain-containing protein [Phthorimaea operculella]|nr:synaphin protein domain-containing protein [Phthorimaea operculella]
MVHWSCRRRAGDDVTNAQIDVKWIFEWRRRHVESPLDRTNPVRGGLRGLSCAVGGDGDDSDDKEKEEEAERERQEAIREAEERRKEKHRKMEEEREKMRQEIRDKVRGNIIV